MSRKKIDADVRKYATELMQEKGYISPVDLLITMDRITIRQVEDWRFKRITYLERVIIGNLTKLNYILEVLRIFAQEQKLQPSVTVYKSWGKGPKKVATIFENRQSIYGKTICNPLCTI